MQVPPIERGTWVARAWVSFLQIHHIIFCKVVCVENLRLKGEKRRWGPHPHHNHHFPYSEQDAREGGWSREGINLARTQIIELTATADCALMELTFALAQPWLSLVSGSRSKSFIAVLFKLQANSSSTSNSFLQSQSNKLGSKAELQMTWFVNWRLTPKLNSELYSPCLRDKRLLGSRWTQKAAVISERTKTHCFSGQFGSPQKIAKISQNYF